MVWVVSAKLRPLYPPGKKPSTHCEGGWVGSRAAIDWCEKFHRHREFFILFYPLLHLYLFVLIVLYFAFCFYLRHTSNIHGPGGIRTRNPSKRLAADTRLRSLDHWDWQGFDPQTLNTAANCSTYCLSRHGYNIKADL